MHINPASPDKTNPQRFMPYQMKDDGQYTTFKSNRQVVFFGIDGKGVKAPVGLIKVGGKDALIKAQPTKLPGEAAKYALADQTSKIRRMFLLNKPMRMVAFGHKIKHVPTTQT